MFMKYLFLIPIIIILFTTVVNGKELNAIRKDNVIVLYDDDLENAAAAVAQTYPAACEKLEKIIGWDVDFVPTIYLVNTHERFERMSGHSLVVGFAIPERTLIVIDYSKILSDPFSISSIMEHELCHLLLHKNIRRKDLPKWLDEGVSQWASGGIADIIMADISRIDSAVVTDRQIPFKYLTRNFPGDNEGLMLAYAQSKSIVDYMSKEYGSAGIRNLLNSLRAGNDINEAVSGTFRTSFDELEKNWYSDIKNKATWLTLLINHLYEIVFFLASVSLIIGYIKIVIRRRAERYEEDDENDQQNHNI
jgi:hypothetical protein